MLVMLKIMMAVLVMSVVIMVVSVVVVVDDGSGCVGDHYGRGDHGDGGCGGIVWCMDGWWRWCGVRVALKST